MAKPAYAMVVTPHPDDAEYGIAGTVARWVKEGKDVVYVVCTNGDKGTSDINMRPEVLAKIREKEQLDAANVLGVREVIFLRHPDQGLEDTYEYRCRVAAVVRKHRPEVVLGPYYDLPPGRGLWMMGSDYIYQRGSGALNNGAFGPFCFTAARRQSIDSSKRRASRSTKLSYGIVPVLGNAGDSCR